MRDASFTLDAGLFPPQPPFQHAYMGRKPWLWTVTDATGLTVGQARTRAGARAAVRRLYGGGA